MNFVKNFGPAPTSIVVEIPKIKKKLVPKKTQTKTNLNGGNLGWNKKKCCDCGENSNRKNEQIGVEIPEQREFPVQDQPQWWRSGKEINKSRTFHEG